MKLAAATLRILMVVAVAALSGPIRAQSHPLDALTADEIRRVSALLDADPRIHGALTQLITLREPAKADVLRWKGGDALRRSAHVVAMRGALLLEAQVDLEVGKVERVIERRGVEAGLTAAEFVAAGDIALANPDFMAALNKRGFSDPRKLSCSPFSMGNFGIRAHAGKRLLKVGCADTSRSTNNIFGWPIERLYALVELRDRKVIQVVDYGIVPIAAQDMNFTEAAAGPLRPPEKPTLIAQPQGSNFTVKGGEVEWGNWRFHVRMESRQGMVISLVRWMDAGSARSVLYQGYMSEMFVPYMDAEYGWYSRTFFDMGEYGLGLLASPLRPGIDCPVEATYLDAVIIDDKGRPVARPKSICIYERNTGDPAWRHYEIANRTFEGRPGVELVVRMASQLGNYDYMIDWVFNHAAEIETRVGATGILGLKGVASTTMGAPTANEDTRFGTLVAPRLVGVSHDHFFNFRLDLDVDGTSNSFQTDRYKTIRLPAASPRRSIYTVAPEIAAREGVVAGHPHRHGGGPVKLRVINEGHSNAVGNPTGYEIMHANHGHLIIHPDDPAARRAEFLRGDVWVTPFSPGERHAAGDYVFASSGSHGLPEWVKRSRPVRNRDLVVWVNMGMHHYTRAEDVPVMPTVWHSFRLRPFNFFDRNPALDMRSEFAR